mmetsp:Transcript_19680/g.61927  ORF Transcript_19680/g.61927 Transcript_19680/m.61927 type:complete len:234 (-) Transcript_19680:443-1144(-)
MARSVAPSMAAMPVALTKGSSALRWAKVKTSSYVAAARTEPPSRTAQSQSSSHLRTEQSMVATEHSPRRACCEVRGPARRHGPVKSWVSSSSTEARIILSSAFTLTMCRSTSLLVSASSGNSATSSSRVSQRPVASMSTMAHLVAFMPALTTTTPASRVSTTRWSCPPSTATSFVPAHFRASARSSGRSRCVSATTTSHRDSSLLSSSSTTHAAGSSISPAFPSNDASRYRWA